jgi:hypothetical protein
MTIQNREIVELIIRHVYYHYATISTIFTFHFTRTENYVKKTKFESYFKGDFINTLIAFLI